MEKDGIKNSINQQKKLHPGDVVYIAPEVKHWHGATKNHWFTHVALEIPAENSSNEWCEKVDDDQLFFSLEDNQ